VCQGAELSRTEANHFPSLSTDDGATTFVANTLNARIEAEYVANRQYTELVFTGDSIDDKCHLGNTGSWWAQTSHQIGSTTSCNDTFTLALPWASHPLCGFANNTKLSDGDYMYITGYLYIRYTDDLGEVENFTLTRSTKVPYSITVKFQKHVTVLLKALNVTSDVKFGMALTEDVYDPVSQILTLELTTIVNWPNTFYTGRLTIFRPDQVGMLLVSSYDGTLCSEDGLCGNHPGNPADVYEALETFPQTLDCDPQVQDKICKQSFTWKAKILDGATRNCTFDGDYHLQIGLYTCRTAQPADEPDCTSQVVNITYSIQDSFVCGEIGVTPSVSGHLYAFPPTVTSGFRAAVTAGKSITQFKLGTYGHFYAQIESDDNVISIHFTDIKFKDQNSASWVSLFDATNPGAQSSYITIYDVKKYFRVYFHSSTFKVNPNSQVVYTFSATCEISFQGNDGFVNPDESRKRTIEYTWTQASAEATTNVFMAGPTEAGADVNETPAGVSSVTFIASVVGAVAGTMIVVFVVVGLALRARSSKEEVSPSLIAASAAASEVANRA